MYAIPGMAKLFFELGEFSQSVKLFRYITSLPFVRNSHWFNDVFAGPIKSQITAHHEEWHEPFEYKDIWDLADDLISQL